MTTMLNNAEAAAAIGISPGRLRVWRVVGQGPRFVKFGPGRNARCAYDPREVEAWKAARTYQSISAVTAAANARRTVPAHHPGLASTHPLTLNQRGWKVSA